MSPYDKYRNVDANSSTEFLIEQREFLSTVGIYAPPGFSIELAKKLLGEANVILEIKGFARVEMRNQ